MYSFRFVFRHDKNERVGFVHRRRKLWVFDCFAGVVDRETDVSDVDQVGAHVRSFRDVIHNKVRGVFAGAALPWGTENYRGENWAVNIESIHHKFVVSVGESLHGRVAGGLTPEGQYCGERFAQKAARPR